MVSFAGLGIPDERARAGILTLIVRDLCLGADVDCAQLAKLTPGCVGADLVALTRKACMRAVRRVRQMRNEQTNTMEEVISMDDFVQAARLIQVC